MRRVPVRLLGAPTKRAAAFAALALTVLPGLAHGPAGAQPAAKPVKVGLIAYGARAADMAGAEPANPAVRAFLHALRELGYVEGRNLVLERRSIEGKPERVAGLVEELLRLNVDVLVTSGNPVARGARQATTTVPIVMAAIVSPVENGLVESLGRPGGNATGLAMDPGPEIGAKRLELLKEAIPRASRVAYLTSKASWERDPTARATRAGAPTLGIRLIHADDRGGQYPEAFATLVRDGAEAMIVSDAAPHFVNRRAIIALAARHRLPVMYAYREVVADGGLMSYGPDLADVLRRAAGYVDRIVKGARPAELPVQQPTKFELLINLKTAKALGIGIPRPLLVRADQVIE